MDWDQNAEDLTREMLRRIEIQTLAQRLLPEDLEFINRHFDLVGAERWGS